MQKFVAKHAAATTGTLSCFDRLLFKGHLALGYDKALDPLAYGRGCRVIRRARRKCLFLYYFYFVDPTFGLAHVRLQTWLPFTIHVYMNGHEWLARQMDRRGLGYRRLHNAFLALDDPGRAQRLADRFPTLPWPTILDGFARRVNPLLGDLLAHYRYYWATHQAEYATDVLFTNRGTLRDLYPRLLRHATLCLRAEDVLTFLGRKLTGHFTGEILNDWKRRWPGARVKHWMKANWIKMYDKHGCVLRVETVINDPYEFKVRRRCGRRRVLGWHRLPKGVAFLPRYAAVSAAANHRYLDALAVVDDPAPAYRALDRVTRPVRDSHDRASRPLNPGAADDLALFAAVLGGEHTLQGFRNRHVRTHLFGPSAATDRRRSAQVSRPVKRLHLRGLVAKIPRSRRWRVTQLGHAVLRAALVMREDRFPVAFLKEAA